jgi:putative endonuclease
MQPIKRNYWVYILSCKDGSYYTGITNHLERRVWEHQTGFNQNCYTCDKRPLKLVYSCHFKYVLNAIRWEKQVKDWNRKKKEALIRGDFELLPELAECKNNTSHKFLDGVVLDSARTDKDGIARK